MGRSDWCGTCKAWPARTTKGTRDGVRRDEVGSQPRSGTVLQDPPHPGLGFVRGDKLWRSCLVAGALAGIAAAAAGLFEDVGRGRSGDAVARVNGAVVSRADFERALRAAGQKGQEAATEPLGQRVLEHLIDQELLAGRGVELGLLRQDRRLRAGLIRAMVERAASEGVPGRPSEAELRAFYEKHRHFFTPPARMRLRHIFFRAGAGDDGAALERAREAVRRLRDGEDFERVRSKLGDREVAPIPGGLLPRAKLLDYLGAAVVEAAARLEVGAVSDPVRSAAGYHVLELLEREAGGTPELAEIEDQVVDEYRRRAGEEALGRYLRMLRHRADVVVSEHLE